MDQQSIDRLFQHWHKLKAGRAISERLWQEIAERMRPQRHAIAGMRRRDADPSVLTDSTAFLAVENFASGLYGMMTNPANRWFALRHHDQDLNNFDTVRDWLYEVETRLLQSFAPHVSRFYSVLPALYADLACFGTAIFYSDEDPQQGRINDSVRPLQECVVSENAFGEIDTIFRRFTLTGAQALQLFAERLSAAAERRAEKDPLAPIEFLHAVRDGAFSSEPAPTAWGANISSAYFEFDTRHCVSEGRYFELPYQVPRWSQCAGEPYGRGIGEQVLPDVKLLGRMGHTILNAAQLSINPPLAARDKADVTVARTMPGGITYGALDHNYQFKIKPLFTVGDAGLSLEMLEQKRNAIREAFHFSLLQLVRAPNMTATEWMGRQEEKLRLLGPNLGRIQSEFLSPLIKRRFGILSRAGQLPPVPPELQGSTLSVDYVSPLARAQMAGEAQSVGRLYESLAAIVPLDSSAADNIDHDEAVQVLGRGWAVPAKIMRGADQVRALRAAKIMIESMPEPQGVTQQP